MESWGNGGASLDESMEESEEYRLLEAYCATRIQQRFPIVHQGPANSKNQDHAQFSGNVLMGKPIKVQCRRILMDDTIGLPGSTLGRVTDHLVQIADSTLIQEDDYENDLESDGTDDDIIKELVELLKKSGDQLDEKFKKDKALLQKIQQSLNYSLFERVTTSILHALVAPRGCAVAPNKQQIAWAFEVTNRLSALDVIPRRRALVFGAQYVQQYYSAWVQQQGGWDAVVSSSEDVD